MATSIIFNKLGRIQVEPGSAAQMFHPAAEKKRGGRSAAFSRAAAQKQGNVLTRHGMFEPDHESVARVRAGQCEAFAQLITRYQARIFHTTFHTLKNREDAEEATQDTFLRAYRGLTSFREDATFATWLDRFCYNAGLNYLEKKRTARPRPATVALEHLPAADHDIAQRERAALVEQAKANVADHFRNVLILDHTQQLPYREITEMLELPINTVKPHLFRARALLRRRMLQAMPQEEILSEVM